MDIWPLIINTLKINETIKNWTKDKGYFGDDIIIKDINNNSISIDAPNSNSGKITSVNVSKKYFEELYNHWPAYLAGTILRNELRKKNRFTRYVLDILQELSVRKLI